MLKLFAICLGLMLLLSGVAERDSKRPDNQSQIIYAHILQFKGKPPQPINLSDDGTRLQFVKGWHLRGDHSYFGGFSGLVWQGADRFLLLGDAGDYSGFRLTKGDLTRDSFLHALPENENGRALSKYERDSEGMDWDPDTSQIWVSFEHHHRIVRYAKNFQKAEASHAPEIMQDWPNNGGAETIVRLADGRFLVIAESADGPVANSNMALLFAGDPASGKYQPQIFGYAQNKGYRVTDGAQLPDGRVLLLMRRISLFSGISAKLAIIDLNDIELEKAVIPQEIALLQRPFPVDNMEGLAVAQDADGLMLWMVSDDNFQQFQRSLLLQFRLDLPDQN